MEPKEDPQLPTPDTTPPGTVFRNPVEPHADMRQAATIAYQMYTAYCDAGFTPTQALDLVKNHLNSA